MSSLAAIDISGAATRVEVMLREPKPGGLPLAGARLPLKQRDTASPMFDFRGLQP